MAGAPASKGEEISSARLAIEDELYRTYQIDEFSIARLVGQIRRLLDSGSFSGREMAILYLELADLHGYKRDVEKAIGFLRSAESLGADGLALALVESTIYMMAGRFLEAVKALEKVNMKDLIDDQVGPLVSQANAVCAFHLLEKLPTAGFQTELDEAVAILRDCGATTDDLIVRVDAVAQFVSKEIVHPILGYKCFAMRSEGCLLYRFGVRMPVEEVADLNNRIISFMVKNFDAPLDDVLSIGVMPFKPEYRDDSWSTYHASV